jgi:hypothetical protein
MRIKKEFAYGMGAIVGLILLISLIALPRYCIYLLGHTNELRNLVEIPSPNETAIADAFNVYGGATSTDLTQVLIRRRNEPFNWWNGSCLFSIEGLKKTKVTWISDTNLEIQHQPGTVYRAATAWNGITVTYSELK